MKNIITIKPNPSPQTRDNKILEMSFVNNEGKYLGCLMSLRFCNDKPVINIYKIDKGIKVFTDKKRQEPY